MIRNRPHDDGGSGADLPIEIGARHLDYRRSRIGPQRRDGFPLEGVQRVRLATLEGEVGDEPVLDVSVMSADAFAELDREGCRDRDRTRDIAVVMDGGDGVPVALQDAADHIAAVEAAHDVDDPADLARLRAQHPLGQVAEIEPRGQRQSDEPEHHGRNQQRRERFLFNRGSIARSSHVRLHCDIRRAYARLRPAAPSGSGVAAR